jgi:hypothetical protein
MDFKDFDELEGYINKLNDNFFWKPINSDEKSIQEFDRLIQEVKASQNWGKELNWKKGRVLEDLAVFLFSRF